MAVKKAAAEEKKFVYVIAGKDSALVSVECEKLVERLLVPEQRVTGLFKADPGEVSAAQILDELRTVPFLSDKRVVVVKDADHFVSENRLLLEKYFENSSPSGVLVLAVSSWQSNTKLAKKLPQVGELISVAEPKRWELPRKLNEYAQDAYGKRVAADAAEFLVELVGENLAQLYGEIDKLALFAGQEKMITAKHVESLTGHNRMFNCFEAIEAAVSGRKDVAISRLRTMFAEDRSAEYTAVGAFAFYFRRMFIGKSLLEKGVSTGEIAGRLRIWRGREAEFFGQLRKISLKQIGAILGRLAEIDYGVKTGGTKVEVAAEQLILEL
jgi:DNA polymerase-3 subunit delta